ncbi:hypothetical protein [Stenotrophomonas sp. CFBP 13718]|uniref:hypothetical protein n=1 Tax=Stenotrophomonas sp. CFBP 13718 TaxID=2775304 RepID=UPI00177C6BE9|nr:hypothetical protein [Stenotrophomonas sp. CFBP 13718]MBD8696520.1 hypothetical protein [Stenotrophomonas sp. CFBP 13718]
MQASPVRSSDPAREDWSKRLPAVWEARQASATGRTSDPSRLQQIVLGLGDDDVWRGMSSRLDEATMARYADALRGLVAAVSALPTSVCKAYPGLPGFTRHHAVKSLLESRTDVPVPPKVLVSIMAWQQSVIGELYAALFSGGVLDWDTTWFDFGLDHDSVATGAIRTELWAAMVVGPTYSSIEHGAVVSPDQFDGPLVQRLRGEESAEQVSAAMHIHDTAFKKWISCAAETLRRGGTLSSEHVLPLNRDSGGCAHAGIR